MGIPRQREIWRLRDSDPELAAALAERVQNRILSALLAQRGVSADRLEEFLDPDLSRLAPPESLAGVDAAAAAILKRIRAGEKIVVFGDYDADGVCATAILVTAIAKLGGNAVPFIPRRFDEGYGITAASLRRLFETVPDVRLVVTVDNGINAVDEVEEIRARGVGVVVTDHHLPGEVLPRAEAVVNPRVQSAAGCEWLCGAGVAFFLAFALVQAAEREGMHPAGKVCGPLLVLAGIATVADIVPLTGQNRVIVAQAVKHFNTQAPAGLRELRDRAMRRADDLTARDFAFLIAPRLNAAGRIDTADIAYELLASGDDPANRERTRMLAAKVDNLNAERKTREARVNQEAQRQIAAMNECSAVSEYSAIVVQGDEWHPGVLGIVAARLLEAHHKPVAVVSGNHGSARAPEGYNVRDALGETADLLERYGGHAAAGGFTLKPGALERFREAFSSACANQSTRAPDLKIRHFDAWLEPEDMTSELHRWIHRRLAPLGEGNPEPVFGLRGVGFRDVRPFGADGRHLGVDFINRDIPRAMWWSHGGDADELRAISAKKFDVFFTLHYNHQFGEMELWIEGLRIAEPELA